jgi:GPI mannosyltransferase 3
MHQRKSKQDVEEESCCSDSSHSHHGLPPSTSFLSRKRIVQVFLLRLIMSTVLQHCADVPDEWWQSTEVAYHNVFGVGHLPWEWSAELRSYIYPLPFDFAFRLLKLLGIDTALLMWLVPKMIASAAATAIDIQTYRLGAKLDKDLGLLPKQKQLGEKGGEGLTVAKIAFIFSLAHWFTGYIGVRTQSNVLETLLLLTATMQTNFLSFLFFAGFGCALRMTCVVPLTPFALIHVFGSIRSRGIRGLAQRVSELAIMLCFWLAISMSVDFMFYGKWTLTPLNFFLFNVLKGHSAIFGTHPWHWYFSTAFPVVSLPFTLILPLLMSPALWKRMATPARWRVGVMCFSIVFTMAVYSLVPHKELRFFYPVVPFMIIIAAFLYLHHPWLLQKQTGGPSQPRFWLFMFFVITNVMTYLIISVGYRRGTLDVMAEVRSGAVLTNTDGTPQVIERLDILTGCYATAGYSYVHGRVKHLRTMDCTPVVVNEATSETLPTERDVFGDHPVEFVRWVYDGVAPADNMELSTLLKVVVAEGGSWAIPNVLIAYTYVIDGIRDSFLEKHGFVRHQTFYHTFHVFQPHEDLTIEIWKRISV